MSRVAPSPAGRPSSAEIPPIPKAVTDANGFLVELCGDKWTVYRNPERRGIVVFNVGLLRRPRDFTTRVEKNCFGRRVSSFHDKLTLLIELFVIERIRTHAPTGAGSVLSGFVLLEKYVATVFRWSSKAGRRFSASDISYEFLSSFARWVHSTSPAGGMYVSFLKAFYSYGLQKQYPGFDHAVAKALRQVKVKKHPQGHLARFLDPVKGAFTWEEQRQILSGIVKRTGESHDRALVQLFWETGIRVAAAIRLRRRHLRRSPSIGEYFLDVPRVKQRRASLDTKEFVISEDLALLLLSLQKPEMDEDSFLIHWPRKARISADIGDALSRWSEAADLTSVRVTPGARTRLPVSPYRFRRTRATTLAENGATPEEIAAELDDKTLAMAVVYVYGSSNIVEVLRDTLDKHPAWFRLIDAFVGSVVDESHSELPEILGGAPQLSQYMHFAPRIGSIGRCGKNDHCVLAPPLSCYSCPFFRAAQDLRPHERQLEQLKVEIDAKVGLESDRVAGVLRADIYAILSLLAILRAKVGKASHLTDRRAQVRRSIAEHAPKVVQ